MEMFTGIIEAMAKVIEKNPQGLVIERPVSFDDLKIGSSVCVSGVCLSVVELSPSSMRFDVVEETWKKTKLGDLKEGDRVNLERSMKAGDRVDGHLVQGHIEGVGLVTSRQNSTMAVRIPVSLISSVSPKGSIAIDGVSLTVAEIDGGHLTIALIPLTLEQTTLGSLQAGDDVNIETDVIMRGRLAAFT